MPRRLRITELEIAVLMNKAGWRDGVNELAAMNQRINVQMEQVATNAAAAANRVAAASQQMGQAMVLPSRGMNQGLAEFTGTLKNAREEIDKTKQSMRSFSDVKAGPALSVDAIVHADRQMSALQSRIGSYTRVLGESHPATQALIAQLDAIPHAAGRAEKSIVSIRGAFEKLGGGPAAEFGRGIFQSVAGISLIAGGAAAAGAALVKLSSALASVGVGGNAQIEQYNVAFEVMLKSADAARVRMKELWDFAAHTPFELGEVVRADRVLQVFGGTVLATGRNLTLVGDIAAGVNRTYEDVALWVGRAYDALQNGRPWGEAALRLQEMGALTGKARAELEDMQDSGASGAELWAKFTATMGTFSGMMDKQQHTMTGLASTVKDVFSEAMRTATENIFNTAKSALADLTKPETIQKINEIARGFNNMTSAVGSATGAVVSLIDMLGKIPVVGGTAGAAGRVFGVGLEVLGNVGHIVGARIGEQIGGAKAPDDILDKAWENIRRSALGIEKDVDEAVTSTAAGTGQILTDMERWKANTDPLWGWWGRAWVGAATQAEQSATQIGVAVTQHLSQALQDAKEKWAAIMIDPKETTDQLLTTVNSVIDRARGQWSQFGTDQNKNLTGMSKEMQEGLQVLNDYATGNYDVCSAVASKWGYTATDILNKLAQIRDGYYETVTAAQTAAAQLMSETDRLSSFRAEERALNDEAKNTVVEGNRAANPTLYGAGAMERAAEEAKKKADEAKRKADEARRAYLATPAGQLEESITSAQTQRQVDLLKSQSQQFINATVEAQLASNKARDELEKAQKAAGLIEYTTLEKEAQRKTISAISFINQQATAVAQTVKASLDAAKDIATFVVPTNVDAQLDKVATFQTKALERVQRVAKMFEPKDLQRMSDMADASTKGIALLRDAVDTTAQIREFEPASDADVNHVFDALDKFNAQIKRRSEEWKNQVSADTAAAAAIVGSQFKDLMSAIDFMKGVRDVNVDAEGNINLLFDNARHALRLFVTMSQHWKGEVNDDVVLVANNVKSVFEAMKAVVDPMQYIGEAGEVGTYQIDAMFENIEYAIGKMEQLSNRPGLQGAALRKLQQGSQALQSVFAGVQAATNVVRSVGETQAAVDAGDIAYGFDQIYSATALAQPAGNGNTYVLQLGGINLSNDPDVVALIEKIMAKTNLLSGGQPVGEYA